MNNKMTGLEIAVIGMAGRFPGAKNIDEFWNNLKNGIESISFFSDEELEVSGVPGEILGNQDYVKAKGLMGEAEYFDSFLFDYSPREAQTMDPQMRIFHECTWEVLEYAGYDPYSYQGLIGLYAGAVGHSYWDAITSPLALNKPSEQFASVQLSDKDFLATRLSYKLSLTGPSFTLFTACSTSLVAVHLACNGLLGGECDMALAGGISVWMPEKMGYLYEKAMILSPDGHNRTFDEKATGSVFGDGVGVVLLKRFEDAVADGDMIHAVIKSSAINNDGNRKLGYAAPSVEGQAQVINTALHMAEVESKSISYLETHGTATSLGDAVEIEALNRLFEKVNDGEKAFCALGSVKSNVGHLNIAAGISGLIKTILALKHRLIPPMLHYENPNPKIDFENSPFYVNTQLIQWESNGYPLRAGVSSFGIGGTNAHVILEEAATAPFSASHTPSTSRDYHLILLSAKTDSSLEKAAENLVAYLKENPESNLADAAYTLQVGRKHFPYRRISVCSHRDEAVENFSSPGSGKVFSFTLKAKENKKEVIFMFPGQGSQYINMGLEIYRGETVFRKEMDCCFNILKRLVDEDIKEIIFPTREIEGSKEKINQPFIAQLLIFIFEYSLARLIMTWGLKPQAMIGYSFGEYVAACLSGVFSLEDALKLVVLRGQLIEEAEPGAMLSVPVTKEELLPLLISEELSLAIDNGPSCIVAGPTGAIDTFERELREKKYLCMRVPNSRAMHSKMMESISKKLEKELEKVTLNNPQIPFISNVTGTWVREGEVTTPGYWAKHLKQTVQFADGIKELLKNEEAIFLEVGPGRDLSALTVRYIEDNPKQRVLDLVRHPQKEISDMYYLLQRLGRLWLYGVKIDWNGFYLNQKRQRVPLPTYPFERQRYWHEGNPFKGEMRSVGFQSTVKQYISKWFYLPSWKRFGLPADRATDKTVKDKCRWIVFSDNMNVAEKLIEHLEKEGHQVLVVRTGTKFFRISEKEVAINPGQIEDYEALVGELCSDISIEQRIIHLWSVTPEDSPQIIGDMSYQYLDRQLERGYYSLLYLAKIIEKRSFTNDFKITIISNHIQEVSGKEEICPGKAAILGPCKVIPQEHPNILCRSIDIEIPPEAWQQEKLIKRLVQEIQLPFDEPVIAYRGGNRWVQVVEPIQFKEPPAVISKLREGGVYMITGGLGSIGLTLAQYLARAVKAKLVLVGRSAFPHREEWENWLAAHHKADATSTKIRKLLEIESFGAEVQFFSADVSNFTQMQMVFQQVAGRWGNINGVIHSAGVVGRKAFITTGNLDKAESEAQFQPKIHGLLVLEKLLRDQRIDFCILMSSMVSLLGGLGHIAYSAVNAFLDAFALQYRKRTPTHWLSIDWDFWEFNKEEKKETSIEQGIAEVAMTPEQGIKVFQYILSGCDEHQILVSTTDLQTRIDQWIKLRTLRKPQQLINQDTSSFHERPDLLTPYLAPENEAQKILVGIWEQIFGLKGIGIKDDFFELGGDSLKAITVSSLIQKELNTEIPIVDFFRTPTIEKLAEYIRDKEERSQYLSIEAVEKKEYYNLSSAQRRIYIVQQMEPGSTFYNTPGVMLIEGKIDSAKVEETFRKIIEKHDCYRTSFEVIDEKPVQRIHKEVECSIEYYEAWGKETETLINMYILPFTLNKPPLLKIVLVKTGEQSYTMINDTHHIICDGVAGALMLRDFMMLYRSEDLPPLRIQYRDYAAWQNKFLQSEAISKQEKYWLEKLSGSIPVLDLPTDYPRPAVQRFEGNSIEFEINEELTAKVKAMIAQKGATLYMFLLAVHTLLMAKYSGQQDILVGTPVVGRKHADLNDIIGMFVNVVVMRNFPEPWKSFEKFFEEVSRNALEAFENQDYQFNDLVERLKVKRDKSRNPLYDTVFAVVNVDLPGLNIPDLTIKPYDFEDRSAKTDLRFGATEIDHTIHMKVTYSIALFKPSTVEKMAERYLNIVEQVLENPQVQLKDINVIHELVTVTATALRDKESDFDF